MTAPSRQQGEAGAPRHTILNWFPPTTPIPNDIGWVLMKLNPLAAEENWYSSPVMQANAIFARDKMEFCEAWAELEQTFSLSSDAQPPAPLRVGDVRYLKVKVEATEKPRKGFYDVRVSLPSAFHQFDNTSLSTYAADLLPAPQSAASASITAEKLARDVDGIAKSIGRVSLSQSQQLHNIANSIRQLPISQVCEHGWPLPVDRCPKCPLPHPPASERPASSEFDIYGHGFPQVLIDAWERREKQCAQAYQCGFEAAKERLKLSSADVARIIVEHTDGVLWKQPEADGHISRFTEALNRALESKP